MINQQTQGQEANLTVRKDAVGNHGRILCERVMGLALRYSFRNWSDEFRCPACGKSRRYSLNFLGRRPVVCDGEKIRAAY